ncbi:restriction endonuclease subunit S [Mediterraneibacter faecis]|uniref:restriction endonuclease subunit S n=1 Tax=Mediterraneibacter faecis TaxID=592978 RepID=UPI0018AAF021|nr:restriction endonuclease subunit S [Mediterraneibacter faecis]
MAKPTIRFKGYTEDWEQRKLDDWGTFYYGRSCPKWSVTEDATIPCIRYGELYTKFGAKIDKVYSYTNMSPENLRFSKGTEVLIPRVGEDPMDYNHCTWLSMPDVAIGEMISVFNTDNNPLFTATMFNATLQNEFAMRVEGGSVTNLYFEKLKNIEVSFPSLNEQERIATYFDSLDHLITLHQRKCEETKTLKKYMLQKMFPQNGQKVPEIRFKGFTEDWEQRKFGDYNDLMTGYPFESDKFSEDGIKLVRGMNVKRGYLDFSEDICVKWNSCVGLENYLLKDGDILIQMDGALIGKSYAKIKENQLPALLVQRVTRARTNNKLASQDFMYQTIQRDFLRYIGMNKTETAVPHLSLKDIRNFEIMVPGLAEQDKIGTYFSNLDHLITLHQRKCEELKNIKKFMLQNMFV